MSTCSSIVFIYTEKRVKWKQKTKKKRKVGYEVRKERKKVNNVLIFPVQSKKRKYVSTFLGSEIEIKCFVREGLSSVSSMNCVPETTRLLSV